MKRFNDELKFNKTRYVLNYPLEKIMELYPIIFKTQRRD